MGNSHEIERSVSRTALAAAISILALSLATPASAQDAAANDTSGQPSTTDNTNKSGDQSEADDIIVTAQFREQKLQDTPIAITAISGDEIANKGATTIADIATSAPNVNIQNNVGSYGVLCLYIRGVGQYDSSFAYEQGVGLYIDDVYHGVLVGSLFDLTDLDRVEILRGPQGTLAGKNSIGGAVKLFSQKPKGDGSGYISATYGSYNRIDLRGAFDIGLADDLALRVSGYTKRSDGFVKRVDYNCANPSKVLPTDNWVTQITTPGDCEVGTLGGIKSWGLRAALRYTPSDNLEINVSGMLSRDKSDPPATEQTASPDPRFADHPPYVYYGTYTTDMGWGVPAENTTNFESITGKIDWKLNDHFSVTSITAYEHLYSNWVTTNGTPNGQNVVDYYAPYHQFTQELRLNGEAGDGLLDFTLGGYYFSSNGVSGARVYSSPIINWINKDPVTSRSKSLFGHVELHPVENLTFTGGIRYTKDRKVYKFGRLDPVTLLPLGGANDPLGLGPLNSAPPAIYDGHSFDYQLGANYRFSDQLMAYANFSTGYKGGGTNPRPFTVYQAVSFNPERVKAYEVGLKSDFLHRRLRLDAAAFLNKYQDIILIDTNGYPGTATDPHFFFLSAVPFNAGDADVKGVEFEATIEPVDGLTFHGSLSYLDFQYASLAADALASGVGIGNKAPYTPSWNWSADVAYKIPLANGASITPRFYADYTGSYFALPENKPTDFIPSRTMLNANITFTSAKADWEFVAGVTNLTDKHYFFAAFDNTSDNVSKSVGAPREFYVTARKNF